jgi:hypothetical protein
LFHIESGKFPKVLQKIADENYLLQLVFYVDDTGLHWKKMLDWSYVAKCAVYASFKALKKRLTFLFDGNAAGDYKLKLVNLLCQKHKDPHKNCLLCAGIILTPG